MLGKLILLDFSSRGNIDTKTAMYKIKQEVWKLNEKEWYNNVWNDKNKPNGNKLRYYRQYKHKCSTDVYLLCNIQYSHRRILAMLRSDTLPLHIESGRHK